MPAEAAAQDMSVLLMKPRCLLPPAAPEPMPRHACPALPARHAAKIPGVSLPPLSLPQPRFSRLFVFTRQEKEVRRVRHAMSVDTFICWLRQRRF